MVGGLVSYGRAWQARTVYLPSLQARYFGRKMCGTGFTAPISGGELL